VFDIGPEKLLLLLALALVIFGPKKLPEMARSVGKGLREFRQASTEFRQQISSNGQEPEQTDALKAEGGAGPTDSPAHTDETDTPGGAT
jgi:sec-independent protein translocase protein TatA